jgi:hypothetical protein
LSCKAYDEGRTLVAFPNMLETTFCIDSKANLFFSEAALGASLATDANN